MKTILTLAFLVALAAVPLAHGEEPRVLELKVYAENWSFEPDRIRVAQGTRVILHIDNRDAPHSFVLKGYRLKVALPQDKTTTVEFVADKVGQFTWKCGRPCGNGCSKMRGKLEVLEPGGGAEGS